MKNNTIACFALLVLLLCAGVQAETVSKRIRPAEDTYVFSNGGSEDAVIRHFDNPAQLKSYTHQSDEKWSYKTYLKFDLSAVCNNPDLISSVLLKIVGRENQGSFQHKISVYRLSSDNWAEDELSFGNRSSAGDAVKITTVTKTIGNTDKWFDFDITAAVKDCKATGKNTLSLMLADDSNVRNSDNGQGSIVTFYSKDSDGENYPRLAVEEIDVAALHLSDIRLNGVSLEDFSPGIYNYEVDVDPQWTQLPVLEATAGNADASVQIVAAQSLTGTVEERTGVITVSSGTLSISYKIVFGSSATSDNALLKTLKVDGTAVEFFSPQQYAYTCYLPHTQAAAPAVTYSGNGGGQQIAYTPPADIFSTVEAGRTATVRVTSGDGTGTTEYRLTFEVLPRLDLYLCIGQSNMAGRGYMDASQGDGVPLENAFLFTPAFGFVKAVNPMNQYSSIRKELNMQEISPSWGFAKYLSDRRPQAKTGLIVNARGGSAMEEWLKGEPLYDSTVERTQKALAWGDLKGIIWHQGESNSGAAKVAAYPAQLAAMVGSLREDLSSPGACFIAGELIYSYSGAPAFNPMIRTVSSFLENADWVSAEGLTPRASGDVHFSRESNILLGERYALKMIDRVYGSPSAMRNLAEGRLSVTVAGNVVSVSGAGADTFVSILDLCGRSVVSETISGSGSFRVEGKGLYVVFAGNGRETEMRKIILR
jgi:hypothetical protein